MISSFWWIAITTSGNRMGKLSQTAKSPECGELRDDGEIDRANFTCDRQINILVLLIPINYTHTVASAISSCFFLSKKAMSARKIYDGPVYDWKDYHAFIHLFETLAKENSDRICIYYKKGSTYKTLTWEQVDRISTNLACRWSSSFGHLDAPVAVLADHSLDYLFYMIALLKLRVVLQALSPRNTQAAVTNMLIKGKAGYMMASEKYADTGKTSADQVQIPYQTLMPFDIEALSQEPLNPDAEHILNKQYITEDEEKIVIITHRYVRRTCGRVCALS